MSLFRVWPPNAKSVELDIRDGRAPMSAGSGGWWFADVSVETNADIALTQAGIELPPESVAILRAMGASQ